LLAIGVLRVLRAVALGRGGGERTHHLRALHAPQVVQLRLQPGVALRGEQRGALALRGPPASHRRAPAQRPPRPPRRPRTMRRPAWRPTGGATGLVMDSTSPWRRFVPHSQSPMRAPRPSPSSAAPGVPVVAGGAPACSAAASALRASISAADSRSTGVSYFPATGLPARTRARSASLIGPMRQRGGATSVRSTGIGMPRLLSGVSCSVDTSASPTPSWPIAPATSSPELATKVSAAVLTAFWSRGV